MDDEPLARDELAFMLGEVGGVDVVGQAGDAHEALRLADREDPELAFVDLRMPGPDGIALAEALKRRRPNIQVIVVTAYDDAALRAFEAQVLDYLLKPARLERVRSAIARAQAALRKDTNSFGPSPTTATTASIPAGPKEALFERLAVRRGGVYVVVEVADVIYFEMKDELVWAVTASDRLALDLTMTNLEQRLSESEFFRSHRGAMVRIDKIRAMEPAGAGTYELILDHPDSPRVPLARERARLLKERIPFAG
ncbi:MAG: LytTR family DNA-binding domain-containing protein [Myxococcales bacterium]